MSSELNSFYESTAFRRLAPAKAKLIREMVDMMENKSTNEKMQIMISYGFRMKNKDVYKRQVCDNGIEIMQLNWRTK